jgi:hypothetical protein
MDNIHKYSFRAVTEIYVWLAQSQQLQTQTSKDLCRCTIQHFQI